MPMICSLSEHGFLSVFSMVGKIMLYSKRFYNISKSSSGDHSLLSDFYNVQYTDIMEILFETNDTQT